MTKPQFGRAFLVLQERRAEFVDRWLIAYRDSTLRVPLPVDLGELAGTANAIVEALVVALGEQAISPGANTLREAEKRVAFAGGSFGMAGASAFDVAALVCALRDTLVEELESEAELVEVYALGDWFCALAFEGYAVSRLDALRLRNRESLERGTPVVLVTPELPVAFPIGEPDRVVLEAMFGRLLLAVVRVGAPAVVIDANGLVAPTAEAVTDALGVFARHRKVAGILTLVLVGLSAEDEAIWRDTIGPATAVEVLERFDDAIKRALAIGGLEVVRRRGG